MYATFQARESNHNFDEEIPEESKGYVLSSHLQWFTYTHSNWYIRWDDKEYAVKYFKEHITDFFDATFGTLYKENYEEVKYKFSFQNFLYDKVDIQINVHQEYKWNSPSIHVLAKDCHTMNSTVLEYLRNEKTVFLKSIEKGASMESGTACCVEYGLSARMITVKELIEFKSWLTNEIDFNIWDLIFGFIDTKLRITMQNIKI